MITIEEERTYKPPKMLSPDEVARRLNVDYRTVIYWLQQGRLKGYKLGKYWRIEPVDLQMFIEHGLNTGGNVNKSISRRTQED